jgi:hypothetical protein
MLNGRSYHHSKTKCFTVTVKTQQQCVNISVLLRQHVSVLLDRLQASSIQRYEVQLLHIMYCAIVYYLQGVHKEFKIVTNYIYIYVYQKWLKVCTGIKHMIYLLTAIGLSPGGSTHLHTNSTQNNTNNNRTTQITTNLEECGPCPVFASFTLAFALQLRKNHGKTSVRVRKTSVRVRKISQGNKNLSQSKKILSQSKRNLSQGRITSVRLRKTQSG